MPINHSSTGVRGCRQGWPTRSHVSGVPGRPITKTGLVAAHPRLPEAGIIGRRFIVISASSFCHLRSIQLPLSSSHLSHSLPPFLLLDLYSGCFAGSSGYYAGHCHPIDAGLNHFFGAFTRSCGHILIYPLRRPACTLTQCWTMRLLSGLDPLAVFKMHHEGNEMLSTLSCAFLGSPRCRNVTLG